jgi:hypothetical protein
MIGSVGFRSRRRPQVGFVIPMGTRHGLSYDLITGRGSQPLISRCAREDRCHQLRRRLTGTCCLASERAVDGGRKQNVGHDQRPRWHHVGGELPLQDRIELAHAANATSTVPVVMSAISDPVGSGIVASLARPGGNFTGMISFVSELAAKNVALLRTMVPTVKQLAAVLDAGNPATAREWEEIQRAAC